MHHIKLEPGVENKADSPLQVHKYLFCCPSFTLCRLYSLALFVEQETPRIFLSCTQKLFSGLNVIFKIIIIIITKFTRIDDNKLNVFHLNNT